MATPTRRRLGRALGFALVATAALAAVAHAAGLGGPPTIEIDIRYSHFTPSAVQVPVGVPVTFVIRNDDPIDHEWIVGDEAVQQFHRTSADPLHVGDPTAVSVPALTSVTTTVTFTTAGHEAYICHLPGHEAYGMVGWVTINP
ncbi:MAG TPA: plastocyanin/azurin family copper-binding protein [Candidatus Limnocylindrales bacterium]